MYELSHLWQQRKLWPSPWQDVILDTSFDFLLRLCFRATCPQGPPQSAAAARTGEGSGWFLLHTTQLPRGSTNTRYLSSLQGLSAGVIHTIILPGMQENALTVVANGPGGAK